MQQHCAISKSQICQILLEHKKYLIDSIGLVVLQEPAAWTSFLLTVGELCSVSKLLCSLQCTVMQWSNYFRNFGAF